MLTQPASLMIYVATQPVDFRKGAEGLALLAKETLGHDPHQASCCQISLRALGPAMMLPRGQEVRGLLADREG